MKEKDKYIEELEEFKSLLSQWDYYNQDPSIRREINKRIQHARDLVSKAGALKLFTISPPPMLGGLIMKNVDPFVAIFEPPYGVNMIPSIIDSIDEAIGVIENNKFSLKPIRKKISSNTKSVSNKVFIVHGKDNELKEATARFLTKLNLEPVILHEQTNKGRTIIEKFEDYSDVTFAVILMTPDDEVVKEVERHKLLKRARQNVVLELGYFIGKLGRKNVVALVKGDLEIPSDLHGILYIGIDSNENWKLQLAREIKSAGLHIDLNKILE
jgi:predicted nucleotide-binding protein